MIDETIAEPAARIAWHCAAKSIGLASAASAGTAGPQAPRNARTQASWSLSRAGAGSGIHRFIWKAPLLFVRTCSAQARISGGCISNAPQAPRPPALATATDRSGGHAPAIGADRIGTRNPKRWQKISVRLGFMAHSRTFAIGIIRPRAGESRHRRIDAGETQRSVVRSYNVSPATISRMAV